MNPIIKETRNEYRKRKGYANFNTANVNRYAELLETKSVELQKKQEWIELDKDNLPDHEVLAKNYTNEYLAGHLSYDKYKDTIEVYGVYRKTNNVTHYKEL